MCRVATDDPRRNDSDERDSRDPDERDSTITNEPTTRPGRNQPGRHLGRGRVRRAPAKASDDVHPDRLIDDGTEPGKRAGLATGHRAAADDHEPEPDQADDDDGDDEERVGFQVQSSPNGGVHVRPRSAARCYHRSARPLIRAIDLPSSVRRYRHRSPIRRCGPHFGPFGLTIVTSTVAVRVPP